MSDEAQVGNIGIHYVTKNNVTCKVHQWDDFSSISIDFGTATVTLFTTVEDVAAIRRILGGW
jgi:hypothetical protein